MLQPKAITRFAILATVFYVALTFPPRLWPPLQRQYAGVFRFCGDAFFSQFWLWPEGRIAFLDLHSDDLIGDINGTFPGEMPDGFTAPSPRAEQDTMLVLLNQRSPGSIGMLLTSSSLMGYVPVALLIALVFATPMRWTRRGWAVLWGLLLVQAFIAIRISALVLNKGFAVAEKPYALFQPGRFAKWVLASSNEVLADNPSFAYVAPVCIWLIVLFGFAMFDRLRPEKSRPPSEKRSR